MCACIYIYTYTYVYIYIYTHMYMCIYIHMYMCGGVWGCIPLTSPEDTECFYNEKDDGTRILFIVNQFSESLCRFHLTLFAHYCYFNFIVIFSSYFPKGLCQTSCPWIGPMAKNTSSFSLPVQKARLHQLVTTALAQQRECSIRPSPEFPQRSLQPSAW